MSIKHRRNQIPDSFTLERLILIWKFIAVALAAPREEELFRCFEEERQFDMKTEWVILDT